MAGRIAPLVQECQRQAENCQYTSAGLMEAVKWQEKVRFWGNAVPFVLGSLATWSVLADLGIAWVKYVTAACAFAAGLIPALFTAVKYDESLDRCHASASELKNLRDRFRQAAEITAHKGYDEFEKEFKMLMDRMELARKEGVVVPDWAFNKGRAKIKAGDYTFDVDIAELEKEDAARQQAGAAS